MTSPAPDDDTPNRFVVTKSTVFHRTVLYGTVISAIAAFILPPNVTLLARTALSLAGAVGGFVLFFVAVFLFVLALIPRVRRGSFWEYEVDCYMRSVIGSKWDHAGRNPTDV